MNNFLRSFENFDDVFDPKTRSEELFGFGKKNKDKNKEPDYSNVTLDDIHKMSSYNKELFQKCFNMIKNAWNWKAYKLPKSLGKDEDGNEANDNTESFEEKIVPLKNKTGYEELGYYESVRDGKLIISGEGIYVFASGQPTEFPLYWKVLEDISTRWKKRLEEKETVIKEILGKIYDGIYVAIDLNTGDGDEGCVCPWYNIEIPIKELAKPRKLTKEEGFKMFKIGIKVLKESCAKCGNPKGFKPYTASDYDDCLEDSGDDYNLVNIGKWDAWEFTDGHPRDEEEGKKFDKMLIDVMNQCNKLLEERKLPYGVDCNGDVEDGKLYIFLGHKEQQKSYMV